MSELTIVNFSTNPCTRETLANELREVGISTGDTIITHTSLRAIGWISGGGIALIQALMDVVGSQGNLMMPTHSGDYSDPSVWQNPAVPEDWWPVIRDTMPAFDPEISPTRGLGRVPELFRNFQGVKRSYHPQNSFAAWGKEADWITSDQPLHYPMGKGSPLQKLYDLNGTIVYLGTDHYTNTTLHYAESLIEGFPTQKQGGPITNDKGEREWVEINEPHYDSAKFKDIGVAFEENFNVKEGRVGLADVKLIPVRPLVDFAVKWLESHK